MFLSLLEISAFHRIEEESLRDFSAIEVNSSHMCTDNTSPFVREKNHLYNPLKEVTAY